MTDLVLRNAGGAPPSSFYKYYWREKNNQTRLGGVFRVMFPSREGKIPVYDDALSDRRAEMAGDLFLLALIPTGSSEGLSKAVYDVAVARCKTIAASQHVEFVDETI
jgi:hypothetical protein